MHNLTGANLKRTLMLSIFVVFGFAGATTLFAQAPADGVVSAEKIRENAATVPEDVRNRMTNDCNAKFTQSRQAQNAKRMFMTDCMAETMKASRQSGEVAPAAK